MLERIGIIFLFAYTAIFDMVAMASADVPSKPIAVHEKTINYLPLKLPTVKKTKLFIIYYYSRDHSKSLSNKKKRFKKRPKLVLI